MKTIIAFISILLVFVLIIPVNAGGKEELQKHFKNVADKVKATENVVEKREILNESFQKMTKAINTLESTGMVSQKDRVGIDGLKATMKTNQDELAGTNGFERISDDQLNNYSDYVVQNMQQAEMITISLVTLLLIIILVVLLV
jgi:hypothetical protein